MTLETRKSSFVFVLIVLAAACASFALAQSAKDGKPAAGGQSEMQLPPGWTADDMQACAAAATPGKMHEMLAKRIGNWRGQTQMWMAPGAPEPLKGECTWTVTSLFDGRFVRCEMSGDLPGMGRFEGLGLTGFDNVTQKFVGSWIDTTGTGILHGVGELSQDGKAFTWTYTHTCPITRKPTTLRQIETIKGPDAWTFEMFGADPKSGKEYKCMQIDFTKKS